MVTKDIEELLNLAHKEAVDRQHRFLLTEHLLYAICIDRLGVQFLRDCGVDISLLIQELEKFFNFQKSERHHLQPITTVMVERIIKRAVEHSLLSEQEVCSVVDVLAAMMKEEESFAVGLLKKQKLTRLRVVQQSKNFESSQRNFSPLSPEELPLPEGKTEKKKEPSDSSRSQLSEEKILREFLIDLNEKARQGKIDPLIGREEERNRLLLILGRRKKNNPILVGDPGVGKTAIVEGLAKGIAEKSVHERFHSYQVYALEMGFLLAGTKFRGDFEERITRIFAILKKKRRCIVFIDEIHTLVGAGSTTGSGMDASNLIKPMLTGGEVQVIGATTFEEYRNHFQKDPALNRRFEKMEIREPSLSETVEILKTLSTYYEKFHQVRYPSEVLEALPSLCKNYFLEKQLPDGAIDIMDLAGSFTKMKKPSYKKIKSSRPEVSLKEVERLISRVSGIPLRKIEHKNRFHFQSILKEIKKEIYGQDHVLEKVLKAVKLSKLGLGESGRPIGSFLFTGPTGVGKTELCRVLVKVLGMHLIRLDMSEYMESHSVSKLIGAPPGYVGFNEKSGELSEQVNKHPHALILLDEIEKAHPDVLNTFLQVMDYGRLTDGSSRQVSFENTLIVMTSNLGVEEMSSLSMGFVSKEVGQNEMSKSDKGQDEIKRFFSPEFRNRLTGILRFHFLSETTIRSIVAKLLVESNASLMEKNLSVVLEPEAVDFLLQHGYDPKMGGRSIKRVYESQIKDRIADYVFSQPTGFFKTSTSKKPVQTVLVFSWDRSSPSLTIRSSKTSIDYS